MLLNLTPHAVVLIRGDGTRVTIPPSGTVARVEMTREPSGTRDGVPLVRSTPGAVTGLPDDPRQPVLVSRMVLDALRVMAPVTPSPAGPRSRLSRPVYAPDTGPESAVRDPAGLIVAVRALEVL